MAINTTLRQNATSVTKISLKKRKTALNGALNRTSRDIITSMIESGDKKEVAIKIADGTSETVWRMPNISLTSTSTTQQQAVQEVQVPITVEPLAMCTSPTINAVLDETNEGRDEAEVEIETLRGLISDYANDNPEDQDVLKFSDAVLRIRRPEDEIFKTTNSINKGIFVGPGSLSSDVETVRNKLTFEDMFKYIKSPELIDEALAYKFSSFINEFFIQGMLSLEDTTDYASKIATEFKSMYEYEIEEDEETLATIVKIDDAFRDLYTKRLNIPFVSPFVNKYSRIKRFGLSKDVYKTLLGCPINSMSKRTMAYLVLYIKSIDLAVFTMQSLGREDNASLVRYFFQSLLLESTRDIRHIKLLLANIENLYEGFSSDFKALGTTEDTVIDLKCMVKNCNIGTIPSKSADGGYAKFEEVASEGEKKLMNLLMKKNDIFFSMSSLTVLLSESGDTNYDRLEAIETNDYCITLELKTVILDIIGVLSNLNLEGEITPNDLLRCTSTMYESITTSTFYMSEEHAVQSFMVQRLGITGYANPMFDTGFPRKMPNTVNYLHKYKPMREFDLSCLGFTMLHNELKEKYINNLKHHKFISGNIHGKTTEVVKGHAVLPSIKGIVEISNTSLNFNDRTSTGFLSLVDKDCMSIYSTQYLTGVIRSLNIFKNSADDTISPYNTTVENFAINCKHLSSGFNPNYIANGYAIGLTIYELCVADRLAAAKIRSFCYIHKLYRKTILDNTIKTGICFTSDRVDVDATVDGVENIFMGTKPGIDILTESFKSLIYDKTFIIRNQNSTPSLKFLAFNLLHIFSSDNLARGSHVEKFRNIDQRLCRYRKGSSVDEYINNVKKYAKLSKDNPNLKLSNLVHIVNGLDVDMATYVTEVLYTCFREVEIGYAYTRDNVNYGIEETTEFESFHSCKDQLLTLAKTGLLYGDSLLTISKLFFSQINTVSSLSVIHKILSQNEDLFEATKVYEFAMDMDILLDIQFMKYRSGNTYNNAVDGFSFSDITDYSNTTGGMLNNLYDEYQTTTFTATTTNNTTNTTYIYRNGVKTDRVEEGATKLVRQVIDRALGYTTKLDSEGNYERPESYLDLMCSYFELIARGSVKRKFLVDYNNLISKSDRNFNSHVEDTNNIRIIRVNSATGDVVTYFRPVGAFDDDTSLNLICGKNYMLENYLFNMFNLMYGGSRVDNAVSDLAVLYPEFIDTLNFDNIIEEAKKEIADTSRARNTLGLLRYEESNSNIEIINTMDAVILSKLNIQDLTDKICILIRDLISTNFKGITEIEYMKVFARYKEAGDLFFRVMGSHSYRTPIDSFLEERYKYHNITIPQNEKTIELSETISGIKISNIVELDITEEKEALFNDSVSNRNSNNIMAAYMDGHNYFYKMMLEDYNTTDTYMFELNTNVSSYAIYNNFPSLTKDEVIIIQNTLKPYNITARLLVSATTTILKSCGLIEMLKRRDELLHNMIENHSLTLFKPSSDSDMNYHNGYFISTHINNLVFNNIQEFDNLIQRNYVESAMEEDERDRSAIRTISEGTTLGHANALQSRWRSDLASINIMNGKEIDAIINKDENKWFRDFYITNDVAINIFHGLSYYDLLLVQEMFDSDLQLLERVKSLLKKLFRSAAVPNILTCLTLIVKHLLIGFSMDHIEKNIFDVKSGEIYIALKNQLTAAPNTMTKFRNNLSIDADAIGEIKLKNTVNAYNVTQNILNYGTLFSMREYRFDYRIGILPSLLGPFKLNNFLKTKSHQDIHNSLEVHMETFNIPTVILNRKVSGETYFEMMPETLFNTIFLYDEIKNNFILSSIFNEETMKEIKYICEINQKVAEKYKSIISLDIPRKQLDTKSINNNLYGSSDGIYDEYLRNKIHPELNCSSFRNDTVSARFRSSDILSSDGAFISKDALSVYINKTIVNFVISNGYNLNYITKIYNLFNAVAKAIDFESTAEDHNRSKVNLNIIEKLTLHIKNILSNTYTKKGLDQAFKEADAIIGNSRIYNLTGYTLDELEPKKIKLPETYLTSDGYTITFHRHDDPTSIILGEITNCCQTIGSAAESCVIEGLLNPYSGFISFKNKNDNIVAQSWVWLTDDGKTLVFDSIESKFGDEVTMFSKGLIEYVNEIFFEYDVAIGSAYTKISKDVLKANDFVEVNLDEPKVHLLSPIEVASNLRICDDETADGEDAIIDGLSKDTINRARELKHIIQKFANRHSNSDYNDMNSTLLSPERKLEHYIKLKLRKVDSTIDATRVVHFFMNYNGKSYRSAIYSDAKNKRYFKKNIRNK